MTHQTVITKKVERNLQREVRRNVKAWRALRGIWRKKKVSDPLRWQKMIRNEWE